MRFMMCVYAECGVVLLELLTKQCFHRLMVWEHHWMHSWVHREAAFACSDCGESGPVGV